MLLTWITTVWVPGDWVENVRLDSYACAWLWALSVCWDVQSGGGRLRG